MRLNKKRLAHVSQPLYWCGIRFIVYLLARTPGTSWSGMVNFSAIPSGIRLPLRGRELCAAVIIVFDTTKNEPTVSEYTVIRQTISPGGCFYLLGAVTVSTAQRNSSAVSDNIWDDLPPFLLSPILKPSQDRRCNIVLSPRPRTKNDIPESATQEKVLPLHRWL